MELQTAIRAPVMLQGANYLLWSRTMKTTLCSKGLWTHITNSAQPANGREEVQADKASTTQSGEAGTTQSGAAITTQSEEALAAQTKWYQEDQMVLSILQNSLAGSLLEAYSYCENAKDLWETLQKVYGNTNNLMRIFEVKKSLSELKQEEVEFTKHYGSFRALWAELEMLRPATIDPITLHERKEQDKVFGLLLTLNTNYTELIKHILREDKLPSLEDVCAKIQKEQGSQELFGNKVELVAAHKGFYKPAPLEAKKKRPTCEHCKRNGHTKKECWILHPELKPSWWIDRPKQAQTTGSNTPTMVHAAGASLCNPVQATPSPVAPPSEFVNERIGEVIKEEYGRIKNN